MRVLHQALREDGENYRGKIIENARRCAEEEIELVGYIVMGFYADGTFSLGFRIDKDRCQIPQTLLPAYVEEAVRRDIITAQDIDEALH